MSSSLSLKKKEKAQATAKAEVEEKWPKKRGAKPMLGQVRIANIGQGSCVIINFQEETIIFDAGSSDFGYPRLYERLYSDLEKKFIFQGLNTDGAYAESEIEDNVDSENDDGNDGDDDDDDVESDNEADINESEEKQEDSNDEIPVDTEQDPNLDKVSKIDYFKPRLLKYIPEGNTIKCIIISHPDNDHYCLLECFTTRMNNQTSIILGGLPEEYEGIQDVLNRFKGENMATVLFTGKNEQGSLQPPYCSMIHPACTTPHLQSIIKAISFTEKDGQKAPALEIIAMNCCHAIASTNPETQEIVSYRISEDSNTNSIVLKLQYNLSRFLFLGDATGCTWNFISAFYKDHMDALEGSILLLSHHGADSDHTNTKEMLEKLKPVQCIVSTGRCKHYHHPRETVIQNCLGLDSLIDIPPPGKPVPITSFRSILVEVIVKKKKKLQDKFYEIRQATTKSLFSTADVGSCCFDFISNSISYEYKRYEIEERAKQSNNTIDVNLALSFTAQLYRGCKKINKFIDFKRKCGNNCIIFGKHSSNNDLLVLHYNPQDIDIDVSSLSSKKNKIFLFNFVKPKGERCWKLV